MKLALILLSFTISSSLVTDCRSAYSKQKESTISALLTKLNKKSGLTNDEKCYQSVFNCLMAKYSYNPYSKYSYFNKGYPKLNSLIKSNSTNVEYRYHRYMIEKNAPSFMISTDHKVSDKAFIKKNLKSSHPLYSLIKKTID